MLSGDDGHLVTSLCHVTCKMVDNGAHSTPTRRVLARYHDNVHEQPSMRCCLKVTRRIVPLFPIIYLTFINCKRIGCMQRRKKRATTIVLEGLQSLSISIPLGSMTNRH